MDANSQAKLLKEHKTEFCRFALTYFNSFGWTIQEEISTGVWKALDPLKESLTIIAIDSPHENFPEISALKKIAPHLVVVSPEYSPAAPFKGAKNRKVIKHTASGLKFCYIHFT